MNENLQDLAIYYGAFLMFHEDGDDWNEPVVWEKMTVDVDEYRFVSDGAFKLHFRMNREAFVALVNVVGQQMVVDDAYHGYEEYDLAHILLMVVWVLAMPDFFRSVALRFGKTLGVLHLRVISALCDMAPTYITWPNAEERKVIKNLVERRTGFPGVVAAVVGCAVKVATPIFQPERYFNRHHDYSIVLQGTCDETLLFRDVYVGKPGSVHDLRVFCRSALCRQSLENFENFLADDEHLLGDGAYIPTDKVIVCSK